ncbi:hypothetical protein [Actinomadura verrucosospora]|uniref:Uncharacterized protein n=1 Tax=Actinomadura verrucosospora TaxID=46165 RepID=A0A7D3VNU8_ACTVE|nr:hypothetical protein [Actinomadura verrucosospora]QKG18790.1 hypothetical protein ACTIVE_0426 [Actinomadura verrucosospora]
MSDSRQTVLREKFVANRERVRSWLDLWECNEVTWEQGFSEIPSPWVVAPGEEASWLERHAPFMDEYEWLLLAAGPDRGVDRLAVVWGFGREHEFSELKVEFRSVADPAYLAEKLALAAHAAALRGWNEDDVHNLHGWILEGLGSRPLNQAVTGNNRLGFNLFELQRWPYGNGFTSILKVTPTNVALDGTPLDDQGVPRSS